MWKNIIALAALVLAVGVSTDLIGNANATLGPMVSTGSNPIRNFGGLVPSDGVITTAPADADLIITGILTNVDNCQINVDGELVVPYASYFGPTWLYTGGAARGVSMFTIGTATLRVPAGDVITFSCSGARYYIQGYLSQP